MDVRDALIVQGGKILTEYVSIAIRDGGLRGRESQSPPPAHQEDGCPACQLHRELAEARGLMQGLENQTPADGMAPGHVRSTIALAATCLRSADGHLKNIVATRPDLLPDAQVLRTQLQEATDRLPEREHATADQVAAAATAVDQCWATGYAITTAYFGPRPQVALPAPEPGDDELREWYAKATRDGLTPEEAIKEWRRTHGGS